MFNHVQSILIKPARRSTKVAVRKASLNGPRSLRLDPTRAS
jgi:hypothetical protein